MKKILLYYLFSLTFFWSFGQTALGPGDIAFVGVNTDGANNTEDSFAFILLKDIDAATQIIFTDRGWNDGAGFFDAIGDGEFTWTSGSARSAGEVITLNFSNLTPIAAAFTYLGDQLFAIQGSISTPTFIAGMQLNDTPTSNDANWDGAATDNQTSALPDALTTGDTAVRFTPEADNWQFSCSIAGCPLSGTPEQIRAIVHNLANWISNDNTVYPGTVDASLGTPTIGTIDNMPPVITCPADQTLMVDANCNTLVPDYTSMVTATDDVTASPTITQSPPAGSTFNGTGNTVITFTATDEAGNSSTCNMRLSLEDNKAPSPICINGLKVELDATTGLGTIFASDFIASPTVDACGPVTYSISRGGSDIKSPSLTLNCDDEESILVRVWAEDVNGNSDYCETYIQVDKSQFNCPDVSPPVITCPPDVTVEYGASTSFVDTGSATANDDTDANPIVTFSDSFIAACGSTGTITRTWTATDESGKSSNCKQTITIVDKMPPGTTTPPADVIVQCEKDIPLSAELYVLDTSGHNPNGPVSCNYSFPLVVQGIKIADVCVSYITYNGGGFRLDIKYFDESLIPSNDATDVLAKLIRDNVTAMGLSNGGYGWGPEVVEVNGSDGWFEDAFVQSAANKCGIVGNADIEADLLSGAQSCILANLFSPDYFDSFAGVDALNIYDLNGIIPGISIVGIPNDKFLEGETPDTYKILRTWTFTDACGNDSSVSQTITVNSPPTVEIIGNDSYCHDGNGVVLDAGAGFASYLWSPGGQTTQTITALEGSYTVTVTNQEGCSTTSEVFVVTQSELLTCSIVQDELTTDHLTKDGVATVTPYGGMAPFTYLWDNGETTQTATMLTYGMHSVTVTDSNGCETSCQIDIAKELYCWINLVQNVSVRGGNDGAARVNGNGGFRPFTYLWDDGSTAQLNSKLGAGIHYVTITDAIGATSRCSITISEPTGGDCDSFLSSVEQDKLTTDHLTQDGVATVYPKGGTAPFTYLWENGETTQTATRLTYGLRTVTVTDVNGCETVNQIDIAKELYCWINRNGNVSVHGGNDGSATVHGNGGYRPFTFRWDDGTTSQLNTNLNAGTHYVTITDAKGATSRCSITVTEPGQEICDGVDNDGDGEIDEGFDEDGDGIADCYDKCPNGDDTVDQDGDGIPDACDDEVCIKSEMPQTACYETAIWNTDNCRWDIIGKQPEKPKTECFETASWNPNTCSWDITGEQPEMPPVSCYETANWNPNSCTWDITGERPEMPKTECDETAVWDFNSCSWVIVNERPKMPETACYENAVWNADTCSWDIEGEQPEQPQTACYETATWNPDTCSWDVEGEQPLEPQTECYETATWNPNTCTWDVEGSQPEEPQMECYETATWNSDTCSWDIEGEQPGMPETLCYETAIWNQDTCEWDIVQDDDKSCAGGSIDECETAFARSSDENVRTCFLDIPNINGNRWGWTNEFPSIDGVYEMDLYAAAGQCDISKGALVGSVQVVYSGGSVSVTVSTLGGYKMTEAQLYVGSNAIPAKPNNGNLTVAPGDYPYEDNISGDFVTHTFSDVSAGDMDSFHVILHAEVCPVEDVSKYQAPTLELSGYPIPFKEDFTLVVISPREMKSELSLYDGIGKRVQTFGNYYLKKGRNEIGLKTNELPAGMYYIYVTTGSGNQILKVLRKP
ncbi:HYR domain-containing protein [Maribacter algicola]|uniref:HYR domain-containing protein n=1 Tax=Maribacter algicola TaxID=2498892 RepID=A0A3R8RY10_9FLAO|nr:HYR domain-containing protein [Maribacter algicola]RRQ47950.1 HYR domain-containing protein [Maribacter algicola]